MKKLVFAVRDDVSELYNDPMFELSEPIARRKFQIMMRTLPEGVNAAEFSLWYLAEYEDSQGMFFQMAPKLLMRGVSDD